MELVIGTRRWSTWSLRPWLVLKASGASFTETLIPLRQENNQTEAEILPHSPSGLVPVLKDGEVVIWDSLAICEYLAEQYPDAALWPADPALRAMARSAASEMHSGFASLRGECPMDLAAQPSLPVLTPATQKNVKRIVALWSYMLDRSDGPFLSGAWGIVDAFFTPVASRFRTYGVHLSDYGDDGRCGEYATRLLADKSFIAWETAARAES